MITLCNTPSTVHPLNVMIESRTEEGVPRISRQIDYKQYYLYILIVIKVVVDHEHYSYYTILLQYRCTGM